MHPPPARGGRSAAQSLVCGCSGHPGSRREEVPVLTWFSLVALVAVLLIGGYGFVRLRRHETDPVEDGRGL
jgi:nitrate reductase NapE component